MKHFWILFIFWCAFLPCGKAGASTILDTLPLQAQEVSPQLVVVDFEKIRATITIDFDSHEILGEMDVHFKMLQDAASVYLDSYVDGVESEDTAIRLRMAAGKIVLEGNFIKENTYSTSFTYRVKPRQTGYFVDNYGVPQFWTQGQGKYTSHWLPSIDDMNDKIEFDLSVVVPENYSVAANGIQVKEATQKGLRTVQFDMQQPMSSYLVALAAGAYKIEAARSHSGVPLELYYYPQDSLKVEPTYRYTEEIFDFLEKEIGVPYPWQVYRQVPVKDFLYAGMENTGCTIFSDSFMVDAIGFEDRNYVHVNAHELAHQWFGDLVTERDSEHHWLHEGFATYYALLAERAIFGDDYFYYKLFESAEQLRALSDQGKGQALVAAGGSSLTYYQKGAWAVHILREMVGEDAFAKAVTRYLTAHKYKNVTTADFLSAVKAETNVDLSVFEKNWLYQSAFQAQEALDALKQIPFMQQFFALQALRPVPLSEKERQLTEAILTGNDYLGQEAIYQVGEERSFEAKRLLQLGITSGNLVVRQAVSQVANSLVVDNYESLLHDESYVTKEQALITLWRYYGETDQNAERRALLDNTKALFGFSDGNIRTLWIALALSTPDYRPGGKEGLYEELIDYTGHQYPMELRKNAYTYLYRTGLLGDVALLHLVKDCSHHSWSYRSYVRQLLKAWADGAGEVNWEPILEQLSEKEQIGLKKALEMP